MVENITKEEFEKVTNQDFILYIKKGDSLLSKINWWYLLFGLNLIFYFFYFISLNFSFYFLIIFLSQIPALIILFIIFSRFIFNLRDYSLLINENFLYYNLKDNYYKIRLGEFNKMESKVTNRLSYKDADINYSYFIRLFNNDDKIFILYFKYYIDYTILYYIFSKYFNNQKELIIKNKDRVEKYIEGKKSKYFKNNKWIIE